MNTEHLAPVGIVTEIEPSELSMIKDREVSLDALNYLGKRMDGMDKRDRKQFLAALSCAGFEADRGLKDIINLTYNLARFTLIEDADNVVRVGRTHMLNIRGGLSESEYNNSKWPHYATQNAAEEGMKLLESGSGIDTEYGKIYVNKDVPFEQVYNGTTFPAYWCEADSVAGVIIGYGDLTEFVELLCEDISIRKALCRLGADIINDCSIEIDDIQDIDECMEKIREVEKTKDLFGLNTLLKNGGIHITAEPPESIFSKEVTRRLSENSFTVSKADDSVKVLTNDGFEVKISENGMLCIPSGCPFESYSQIEKIASETSEYCSAYEKATLLNVDSNAGKYRCLAEFNNTVLAAKYQNEYGFEFVTWEKGYYGKSVFYGNYYGDYTAAKENFAVRSGLINEDRIVKNDLKNEPTEPESFQDRC